MTRANAAASCSLSDAPVSDETEDLLTATRLSTVRRCPRQHYFRFELGLSRVRTAGALRLGGAFHFGRELYNSSVDAAEAIERVTASYENVPD